jgi:hypothetical protein
VLFCSSQLVLPGGGVFIAGGGSEENPLIATKIFDYGGNALARRRI